MKKPIRMTLVILLGAAGSIALLESALPDTTPDVLPATVTAYLNPPAAPPLSSAIAGIPVAAAVSGRVWEVYFSAGQRVRKGQVLVKVAEKLPTTAQHRLQQLVQQQQLAYTRLAAQRPAAAVLAAAAAELAATRQRLATAPSQLSFLFVTAPQDGLVATRTVAPGDYLTAGNVVATLADAASDDTTLLLSSLD